MNTISPVNILSRDPIMRRLVHVHKPFAGGKTPVFTSIVRAIISQQLSDAAASAIYKRLRDSAKITPDALRILKTESFRACGISGQKASYIKEISRAAKAGSLNNIRKLADDDAIKTLVGLKGVGNWTAQMVLIFALGRDDVWPHDDAGLIRAAKNLYGIKKADDFISLGDRFRPYRSFAAWYLWCSLDGK